MPDRGGGRVDDHAAGGGAVSQMHELAQWVSRFGSLTLSVLPWFAVGIAAAAVVQTFVPPRWAARALGGRAGLPVAIAAGALMPGCSRTTMPLAIGLRGVRGARLGSLTALVFVAPLLSPITVALTWSLLGWRMTVARVIAALAGSALLGALINRFEPWFEANHRPRIAGASPELDDCCDKRRCSQNTGPAPAGRVAAPRRQRLRHHATPHPLLPGRDGARRSGIDAAARGCHPEGARRRQRRLGLPIRSDRRGAALRLPGRGGPPHLRSACQRRRPGGSAHVPARRGRHVPSNRRDVPRRSHPRVTYFYVAYWITFVIIAGVTFQALSS